VAKITENSRVPFGRKPDKGKRLGEVSDKFLAWIAESLWDTDMHTWAYAAKKIICGRALVDKLVEREMSLTAQADAFLRNRGYGDLARKH
jgi:hypothetical protein